MSETLTGKQRFRSERPLFGAERLVLQVQVAYHGVEFLGGFADTVDYTFWRDARTTDLPNPYPITTEREDA